MGTVEQWAVFQFYPGLPAEGTLPAIPDEPPEILASGFATEQEADDAIDISFGDRFNVSPVRIDR